MIEELKSAELHSGRDVIYSLLSHVFLYAPSDKMYKMLDDIFGSIDDIDEVENAELHKIITFLTERKSIKAKNELSEYDLETARNYTRVFCLTDSVPMSESYYTSREKLIMQESRDKVLNIFTQMKFEMKDLDSNEPEDHISLELAFMSYMAMRSKNSINKNDFEKLGNLIEVQKMFISEHILLFIDSFVERVCSYPESEKLYAPLAKFMADYVKEDLEMLT